MMNTTLRGTSLIRAGAFLSASTWLRMLEKSNSQTVFHLEPLYRYFILNYHAKSSDALKKTLKFAVVLELLATLL